MGGKEHWQLESLIHKWLHSQANSTEEGRITNGCMVGLGEGCNGYVGIRHAVLDGVFTHRERLVGGLE